MHPSLSLQEHRPWPIPDEGWRWRQSWCDLLFAHWQIDAAELRSLIPRRLELDTFDGKAWIGVVPFRMEGVGRRRIPAGLAFPELNVRTYVRLGDKPGVWFFSLDASSWLAVLGGRWLFSLPYFRAAIQVEGRYHHRVRRRNGTGVFDVRFRPTGDPFEAATGSLEHWLTERYCLYAESGSKRLYRTDVHHVQWPLQPAEATFEECRPGCGIRLDGPPAHLLFARRVDVVAWAPVEV